MFCKWCGNSIQLTDKQCPSCGRETPPLSDCGGFYNLKHANCGGVYDPKHANGTAVAPATEQVIYKEVPHCAAVEKVDAHYFKERKASKIHHTMTMLCFVAVLIVLACVSFFTVKTNSQLRELKNQISNIEIEMPTLPIGNSTEDPTESQADESVAESAQYHFLIVTTIGDGDVREISNTYDFSDYAKSAKVTTVTVESENEQSVAISYALNEESTVELNLKYAQNEREVPTIGVKCNTDLPFFLNQEFTYEWQYCSNAEIWAAIDVDVVTADDQNYCHLVCESDWLNSIAAEEQPIELRCVIQIANEDGDSMQITMDGISIVPNSVIDNE